MNEYAIQCGIHKGTLKAKSIGEAWRKLTKGKKKGFARLVRFSENGGIWHYVVPETLDQMATDT